jgi:hypothetical protein
MLKYIFALIIAIHGLIHCMGFAKAFGYGNITQLTKAISKTAGVCWLMTAAILIVAMVLLLLDKDSWPVIAIIGAIISQVLIFTVWQDTKFGSIANILVLIVAITSWGSIRFEAQFTSDVKTNLQQASAAPDSILTNADLRLLPPPVQQYIRYSGAINKPIIKNMRIIFEGNMRDKGKDWFKFRSVQYNFFEDPARLFFMKGKMYGLTVPGYHKYQQTVASMDIRLFGMIPIVQLKGPVMNKAETVTLFNDMCLLAPATLIDNRIKWVSWDSSSAKAIFTNGSNKITATLYFNRRGQLINFISDDRTAISTMQQYRFSTPVKDYQQMNGRNIMTYGETIWHYPDGEFVYGKFNLKSVEYNVEWAKENEQ